LRVFVALLRNSEIYANDERDRILNPASSDLPMNSVEVSTPKSWTTRRERKNRRLQRVARYCSDGVLDSTKIIEAMEELVEPGDRICLEGNNQKQADFLSRMLAQVDPERIYGLHLLISVLNRPEHMDLFERRIANRVDFSFSGPQAFRLADMVAKSQIQIGGIHTYLELYGRYFIDLTPDVSFIAADCADKEGNLYTGANTEETPVIAEATAFRDGIVVAQVNEIRERLPRVDIPGSWIDLIVVADRPYAIEPLFTRDPALITDVQILMAMLVIRGVYERHGVRRLNHGIGFDTAAIELLLPTYGESLGLRGKISTNWILNPHPTLIPAIESGWVESVHCFGGEVGMERYVAARPDIFFTGADGSLRSNRAFSQMAGLYATDLFIGSTLQMDGEANSSTATSGRIAGFGGAPNMGSDPRGRRHATPAWLEMSSGSVEQVRGRKIVVQLVQTFREGMQPSFVQTLDAVAVGRDAGLAVPPIMIYGDDVTHVVTEEGIAYLYRVNGLAERRAAICAIAGVTTLGAESSHEAKDELRKRGIVAFPEDLGIRRSDARRSLLAAHSVRELVEWSGGLYNPPMKFRSW
jgi:malonate decarboxylase alpha subunit